MSVHIERVAVDHPDVASLIADLDADLDARYEDVDDETEVDRATLNLLGPEMVPPRGVFLVAYLDGRPVGCGGLRGKDGGVAEVKRMYVARSARGRGVGRALLAALEAHAATFGFWRLVLETGDRQREAIGLYESAGWTVIPNYGAYRTASWSRCYGKELSSPPSTAASASS